MSSHDNNDDMFEEEEEEEEVQGEAAPEPSAARSERKRSTTSAKSTSADPPMKVRKQIAQRSEVWAHFIRPKDDSMTANCRYCGTEISCDSKTVGTSPMRSHLKRCKMFAAHVERGTQKVLSSDSSGSLTASIRYDKDMFRRSVNEMIVLNELPFSFVESEGFRRFVLNVLPCYHVHCRRTATKDIFAMFLQEKVALKNLFASEKKRVSLTTDIWVAPTTSCSYMVVTAHWIDINWVMQKRIINFKPVIDHKGDTIASHLIQCLEEWGIEKVFTVTVDNAKGNDKALRLFMNSLRLKEGKALIRDGDFLHMRCCAHILNLIVNDGLAHVRKSIVAIRNAVKYVRSSTTRYKSFELRVETGNVSRGSLCLDVKTRWNSTYLMLIAALKLRVAFQKMLEEDMPYNEYFLENETEEDGEVRVGPPRKRIGPPSSVDWEDVGKMVKFLRIFFNCTLAFSASKSVTSTMCYNEIFIVEKNLIALANDNDEQVRKEAVSMRAKFEKYWDDLLNMNPLVIIASVLDPRNKMQFASICFDKLYGRDSMESKHLKSSIRRVMKELYDEYVMIFRPSETGGTRCGNAENNQPSTVFDLCDDDGYDRSEEVYMEMDNGAENEEDSCELDIYLIEKVLPRNPNSLGMDYDVLAWWKRNSLKYPILAELARDILAVQVSSVASESAFSTSGRILDPFRSCLTPYMTEALICTQQWLRNSIVEEKLANLAEMFEELNFHESLDAQIPVPAPVPVPP